MPKHYPAYTHQNLRRHHLPKLTAREVHGARRINPRGRAHKDVHYVPVQTYGYTTLERFEKPRRTESVTYSAIDRNAAILARIAEYPGTVRFRLIFGLQEMVYRRNAAGKITSQQLVLKDYYSTGGWDVKEYSWDEMRMFFADEAGNYSEKVNEARESPMKHKREKDNTEDVESWPLLYVAWEIVP